MQSTISFPAQASDAQPLGHAALHAWSAAALIASFGTWVLYRVDLGLNFALFIALGVVALTLLGAGRAGRRSPEFVLPVGAALVLATAVAITADFWLSVLLVATVGWLGARTVLACAGAPLPSLGRLHLVSIPVRAAGLVATESGDLIGDGVGAIGDGRHLPATRGIAWAIPIVTVFFLLLAEADPSFASARKALIDAIADLSILPRIAFFGVLGVIALGTFGLAATAHPIEFDEIEPRERLQNRTVTERAIILGAVVVLFAVFLALQLAHLFGNPGGQPGSGVTYAEAIHQGFGELTFVVSLATLLVVGLDRSALRGSGEPRVRFLSWLLLGECLLMLFSAWQRLAAYEQAYGYTVLRIEVHLYIVYAALGVLLLFRETLTAVDPARLARRGFAAAVAMLALAAYWNVPAWVIDRNIERNLLTGQLDTDYLARGAGDDSLPALERGLAYLDKAQRADVLCRLNGRYARPAAVARTTAWYEWNLRRSRAEAARARLLRLPVQCPTPTVVEES